MRRLNEEVFFCSNRNMCFPLQAYTVRLTLMSVTVILARMVPRARMLPTPIDVTALSQSLASSRGVGTTVMSFYLAANSTCVSMEPSVSLC